RGSLGRQPVALSRRAWRGTGAEIAALIGLRGIRDGGNDPGSPLTLIDLEINAYLSSTSADGSSLGGPLDVTVFSKNRLRPDARCGIVKSVFVCPCGITSYCTHRGTKCSPCRGHEDRQNNAIPATLRFALADNRTRFRSYFPPAECDGRALGSVDTG